MKSLNLWLVVAVVVALSGSLAPASPPADQGRPNVSAAFKEVSRAMVCQCGCNSVLTDCAMQGCSSATPMRAEIRRRLLAGESKEAIVASFVDRYGLEVLSAPPASGFNLTAWIMPFVALLAGAWVTKRVLSSWKRQSGAVPSEGTRAELSDELRARIEKELEKFES